MEKRGVAFALVVELILVFLLILVKETQFGYSNRTAVLSLATLILGGALFIFYLNHSIKLPVTPHWITEANAVVLVFVFITEIAGYAMELVTTISLILLGISLYFVFPLVNIKAGKVVHHHTKEVIHKERKDSQLIGSTNGKKSHYQSCIVGKRIPKAKMIIFKNKQDALTKGYKVCELCVHKSAN